jgi:hypothetical protein
MKNMRFEVVLSLALLGCASGRAQPAMTPFRLSASDWGAAARATGARAAPGQPIIVDFKKGDRLPVIIQVDGDIAETTPALTTVWLTAKRDFSLRLSGAEIKTSLDGVHFDDKPSAPGRFQLGWRLTPEDGGKIVVHVTTPEHAVR